MNDQQRAALVERIRTLSSPLEPRPTRITPVTQPLPGIRAVLFDVYGTLVISACGDIGLAGEQDREGAFHAALAAAGIASPSDLGPDHLEAAIRAVHAERRGAGVEYPEVDILAVWRSLVGETADLPTLAVEHECRVNPVWPMPGLAGLLETLHGRGVVLGIVSNAQFYTPLMLEAFLGLPLADLGFDPRCCAFSYRLLEAKPSPRVYREALEGLAGGHGIAPGEVLYVGNDVRNDIWPAARVGCRTALFAGDARSLRLREDDPLLADVRPDRIVTELGQIAASILVPDG